MTTGTIIGTKQNSPRNAKQSIRPDVKECWQDAEELRWAARHWAVRIGVKMPHIHIRPMTSKWASMSTAGRLTLDAGLVNVPKELGDFVIVHELVHMLAPNHSKLFKSFMYAYMPDWAEREERLKQFVR